MLIANKLIVTGKDKSLKNFLVSTIDIYFDLYTSNINLHTRPNQQKLIDIRIIISKNRLQFPKYKNENTMIPYLIHKIWVTSNNDAKVIPRNLSLLIERTLLKIGYNQNEKWSFNIWSNNIYNIPYNVSKYRENKFLLKKNIYKKLKCFYDKNFKLAYYISNHFSAALATDLLRWCILFEHGGVYSDNDFDNFNIRQMENINKYTSFYIPVCESCKSENKTMIVNYIFGLKRNHHVALESCDLYTKSIIHLHQVDKSKSNDKQLEGFFINDASHTRSIYYYTYRNKEMIMLPHSFTPNSNIIYFFNKSLVNTITLEKPSKVIGMDHQANSWLYNSKTNVNKFNFYTTLYNRKLNNIDKFFYDVNYKAQTFYNLGKFVSERLSNIIHYEFYNSTKFYFLQKTLFVSMLDSIEIFNTFNKNYSYEIINYHSLNLNTLNIINKSYNNFILINNRFQIEIVRINSGIITGLIEILYFKYASNTDVELLMSNLEYLTIESEPGPSCTKMDLSTESFHQSYSYTGNNYMCTKSYCTQYDYEEYILELNEVVDIYI
jgi:hypothetical protein